MHKILLVDDSKSARYALRLMLKKHGYDVDMAESAEIALEMIKDQLPDAVFMDHLMPGMNGFEALDELKGNDETRNIPVVMCTSNDDEPYQIQARQKGALGILPKPATPGKLTSMLEAIESAIKHPGAVVAEPAAAAPTAAAAPAVDEAAIAALVSAQMDQLMEEEVEPLISESVESRLGDIKSGIFESVMERSAVQMAQWMEAEMAEIREQLPEPVEPEDLSGKLDTELKQIKTDLVKMETEHAQTVMHKINNEVLPELVGKQIEQLEQRLYERLDLRMGELSERLVQELPASDQLIRQLSETAEAVAEHKAEAVASARAQEVAESAAEEKSEQMSEFMLDSAQNSTRLMYMLAGGAAGIGVLSSIVMSLLL